MTSLTIVGNVAGHWKNAMAKNNYDLCIIRAFLEPTFTGLCDKFIANDDGMSWDQVLLTNVLKFYYFEKSRFLGLYCVLSVNIKYSFGQLSYSLKKYVSD